MDLKNPIKLGYASKPHGLKGHVAFVLPSGKQTHLKAGHEVWLMPSGASGLQSQGAIFKITEIKKGNDILVKLEGVEDRTALEKILPFEIFCDRSQFPQLKEGEFYVADLLGLKAVDESGTQVGTLKDYYETPGQLIFTIQLLNGEMIDLPYVKHFFPRIDILKGEAQVLLPEVIE
ncbi:MAG: ribosome maturation factor RimM [Bacteriovoracaceae bacterium]|nr:ribosome maturation factor RimM [Bacteriovoracaceae bacterium]